MLALLLASCGSKSQEKILKTVPSETNYFAIADLGEIMSDLTKDEKQQITELWAKMAKGGGNGMDERWQYFFSENSEVDFGSSFVLFDYKRALLQTFYVKNADKFMQGIAEATGIEFQEENGVYNSGNTVFVIGKQAWFASDYPSLDSSDIAVLSQLSEDKSILSNECAKNEIGDDDVTFFLNLDNAMSGFGDIRSRMILNLIFDDASYMVSHMNFEKGKAINEIKFLNYKGKPAPFALKTGKIDISSMKDFEARGNVFGALSITPEFAHNIVRQFKDFLPVPADVQQTLEQLDGDIVVAYRQDSTYLSVPPLGAKITFKSKDAAEKAATFANGLTGDDGMRVFTDGKCLYVMGDVGEGMPVSDVADSFKGASMGVTLTPGYFENLGMRQVVDYIETISVMLEEEDKSAKIEVTCLTKGEGNSIVALLGLLANLK